MPEEMSRRMSGLQRNVVAGFYVAVLKVLQAVRFYHARNERYAATIWTLAGSSLLKGRVVLDLGCGSGYITARLHGAHLLVGIDSDRFNLLHSIDPSISAIQACAERLPIRSGSVAIVVAISLVEHIADQGAFFRELVRTLEPEGHAVLQIPELKFPIEPHTKWPLLHVWNASLRSRVLAATGYVDLNMSTSLARTILFAEAAGFHTDRVVPIWHFRLARILGLPMGYFILFGKDRDWSKPRATRGLRNGS